MLIPCPFCGARDLTEFSYLGDGGVPRPDPAGEGALERFVDAVYVRNNPAGLHVELWYHALGCRSWIRVTRYTKTHEISAAEYAQARGAP